MIVEYKKVGGGGRGCCFVFEASAHEHVDGQKGSEKQETKDVRGKSG